MFYAKPLFLFVMSLRGVHSITQTAQLDVQLSNGAAYTLLASQASFGSYPRMGVENNEAHPLSLAPWNNPNLCINASTTNPTVRDSFIMVPRGECTFQTKAMNAQRMGAVGVIIRGSLSSRYTLNATTQEIIYPSEFNDFDCAKGRAEIPASAISLSPGYDAEVDDSLLSGSTASNLCLSHSPNSLEMCDSKACLLTGNKSSIGNLEACCAWDLHVWLYNDPVFGPNDVSIPAVYITYQQGQQLLQDLKTSQISIIISSRVRASYNLSAILIWALGVFVCATAAYLSASDYRSMTDVMVKRLEARSEASEVISVGGVSIREQTSLTSPSNRLTMSQSEDTLELNAYHALGFIVMASSGLLILFFFKIYGLVKVMYGIGCSRAVAQVFFTPILQKIFLKLRVTDKVVMQTNFEDLGDITTIDIMATLLAFVLGGAWLFVAFTVHHPETNTFFWVTQDVLGACMCIMFLSLIKINSMRVASILLMVAFFYDIFFVFVTPLIFKGESVMITVATSGGPPKADPSWCEKYPDDSNCQGGDPLPMLLTVPRIYDYQGGASLLGLGDIVLPGLLLSFAARLDAAKTFMGVVGGGSGISKLNACCTCHTGYFAPLVLAYAIGLLMANAAVYIMNMGQPALLYLVPMCLGTMCFMGWKRNELSGLWDGPKLLKTVDAMIYGGYEPGDDLERDGLHEALSQEKSDDDT